MGGHNGARVRIVFKGSEILTLHFSARIEHMKILILGHKGMLGSDLLLRLFAFMT